jgi:hypothetical protein
MVTTMKHSTTATHTISKMFTCKQCKQTSRIQRDARFFYGWEQVQQEGGEWVDANSNAARITCPNCHVIGGKGNVIRAIIDEAIECGPKCHTAKGPVCECSCGAVNHGKNY